MSAPITHPVFPQHRCEVPEVGHIDRRCASRRARCAVLHAKGELLLLAQLGRSRVSTAKPASAQLMRRLRVTYVFCITEVIWRAAHAGLYRTARHCVVPVSGWLLGKSAGKPPSPRLCFTSPVLRACPWSSCHPSLADIRGERQGPRSRGRARRLTGRPETSVAQCTWRPDQISRPAPTPASTASCRRRCRALRRAH